MGEIIHQYHTYVIRLPKVSKVFDQTQWNFITHAMATRKSHLYMHLYFIYTYTCIYIHYIIVASFDRRTPRNVARGILLSEAWNKGSVTSPFVQLSLAPEVLLRQASNDFEKNMARPNFLGMVPSYCCVLCLLQDLGRTTCVCMQKIQARLWASNAFRFSLNVPWTPENEHFHSHKSWKSYFDVFRSGTGSHSSRPSSVDSGEHQRKNT